MIATALAMAMAALQRRLRMVSWAASWLLPDFPGANFHIQDTEMAHVTGRRMRHAFLQRPYEVGDVTGMVRMREVDTSHV